MRLKLRVELLGRRGPCVVGEAAEGEFEHHERVGKLGFLLADGEMAKERWKLLLVPEVVVMDHRVQPEGLAEPARAKGGDSGREFTTHTQRFVLGEEVRLVHVERVEAWSEHTFERAYTVRKHHCERKHG
jgi:hypothetical protein